MGCIFASAVVCCESAAAAACSGFLSKFWLVKSVRSTFVNCIYM